MDLRIDQLTDGPTDRPSLRDAMTRVKKSRNKCDNPTRLVLPVPSVVVEELVCLGSKSENLSGGLNESRRETVYL